MFKKIRGNLASSEESGTIKNGVAGLQSAFHLFAAPSDYTAVSGHTVTFGPSDSVQQVEVRLQSDAICEGNETFRGLLSLPSGSQRVTLGERSAIATILDDDG